ncbi:hypothetical protein Vretimale_13912 [Volvox reticuliferus]|nr:hypothetical protein Vretimale_13912 [Volvox reticuliferus]
MPMATERAASTVLLSSLEQDQYKFQKLRGATTLYMPVWTDDEIEKCRIQLFPSLENEMVQMLVSKWGNIPRYVLEKAMDVPSQRSLDNALSICQWKDIMQCIGAPSTVPYYYHKLLHLEVVSDEYNMMIMKLASPYVVREIEMKEGTHHVGQLQHLVHLSICKPEIYGAVGGTFFKNYAHRCLQQGGSFQVRRLGPSNMDHPKDTELFALQQCSDIHEFNNLEEVEQRVNSIYYLSQAHNVPAVNAMIQPNILFQMTITQNCQVNPHALKTAAGRLLNKPARLYFVVPDYVFKAFSFVAGVPQEIEQWVLTVPWM